MLTPLPSMLFGQEVAVEPYLGASAYGPRYGAAVAVACFLAQKTRVVRAPDGQEVTSTSTFYARSGLVCPAESRVTLPDGRVTRVIARLDQSGGGMPTPDHVEVQLL